MLVDDTLTAGGNSTDPSGANPEASPAAAAAMENSPTGEQQTSVWEMAFYLFFTGLTHCNDKKKQKKT